MFQVGGSIAGLFTGILLSKLSQVQSVTILERYAENQQEDQGAGIRMSDDVIEAITQATGLQPQDYCLQSDRIQHLSEMGDVVMTQPLGVWCTNWRQVFLALLGKFNEAGRGEYRHHCNLKKLEDNGGTVNVTFDNADGVSESTQADIVIGADGLSSTTRELLAPGSKREYVGYTVLRGLTEKEDLSPEVFAIHDKTATFAFNHDSQIICYWVPAGDGRVSDETQVLNWAWYNTFSDDQFANVMTGKDGRRHHWSLSGSAMKDEVANNTRTKAKNELPRAMAEMVEETKQPFLQVVSDMVVPANVFMDGKVVLIGDAVAGQRPHTASSCTQCCFHAILVTAWVEGLISTDQMSKEAREYSNILIDAGKQLGVYTQSTTLSPAEKAKGFFGTWFPTQAKLSATFKEFLAKTKATG